MAIAKPKPFPLLPAALARSPLVQNLAVILAVNWVMQGMRGMQRRELAFRLLLEALLTLLLLPVPGAAGVAAPTGFGLALFTAHTLNFLLNGQFWVCLRYAAFWRRDPAALDAFLAATATRLRALPWLHEAFCIGSRGAGQGAGGPRSDIDLRLVFPPGLAGWLRTNLLLTELRLRAFFAAVPLDLYGYDDLAPLARFRVDEPVLLLCDRRGRLARALVGRKVVRW